MAVKQETKQKDKWTFFHLVWFLNVFKWGFFIVLSYALIICILSVKLESSCKNEIEF